MWGRFVICFLIWLSWLSSGVSCAVQASQLANLGGEFTANDLRCGQWERTDKGDWIAEGEAVVDIDGIGNVTFRGVIVRDRMSDLYLSLEAFCRAELDGGIDYIETPGTEP